MNTEPVPPFRDLATMLRSAWTDIKVQQELLRHANIQTTMNIYTQAVSDQKRAAEQQNRPHGAAERRANTKRAAHGGPFTNRSE